MKLSITEARKLGLVAQKGRKSPHCADLAREKGKAETQIKAWVTKANKVKKKKSTKAVI